MKKLQYLIAAILLLSSVNLFSQEIKVQKLVLENGLTIFLSEDHTRPEVFGAVITKAGSKDDPKDATGMAHYQEHMLFKGTETLGTTDWEKEKRHIDKIFALYDELGKTKDEDARKKIQDQINVESLESAKYAIPNELSNIIKSMGGTNLNAGTGPDNTVFYNAFPPNQINKWIDLYAHRFEKPVFRSFQAELEVVYEEKNMYEDQFFSPLLEKFNYNFFRKHPYGQQTTIGTIDDLKNPSLTKMYEFFQNYYVSNNMAVALVGDFNSEEIIPILKEKFGKWKRGTVPEKIKYVEEDFKGREEVKVKMSPISVGVLGFRIPETGSKDEIPLEICNRILSNNNETGLLNQLVLDNKIMEADVFSMPYQDYGAELFLFIPKIFGQNLKEAEALVLEQIKKLKEGDFDDKMIEAIKNELYVEQVLSLESNEEKALAILDLFSNDQDPEYINQKAKIINAITKDDVLRVANQYFGDNYLAFLSKMGFPKKKKIDKPDFEPLKVNTNAKSIYAKHFETIKSATIEPKFVNFDDVSTYALKGGKVFFTENKQNDVFNLEIKFGIGEDKKPLLKYASKIMNYASIDTLPLNVLKMKFADLGCSYQFSSDANYTYASLEGIDQNYKEAVDLFMKLIYTPTVDAEKIQNIIEEEKSNRKTEDQEPDAVATALLYYVTKKDKSPYLNRLSMKEIKKLDSENLLSIFKDATSNYYSQVHIVANNKSEKTDAQSLSVFKMDAERKATESPLKRELDQYTENVVFYVNQKKALQSKIYLFANGDLFDYKEQPNMEAFNLYFGGGFSGLVLQEVREYRSLAYTAIAFYQNPLQKGLKTNFIGYVGTQADKTLDALAVFDTLIRHMPEKTERLPMIKNYLVQSAFANQPQFRDLSETIEEWKLLGYTEDPAKYSLKEYDGMTFENITAFYQKHLQKKAIVTIIVTNKKRVNPKDLEKYGKVIIVKQKDLYKK